MNEVWGYRASPGSICIGEAHIMFAGDMPADDLPIIEQSQAEALRLVRSTGELLRLLICAERASERSLRTPL